MVDIGNVFLAVDKLQRTDQEALKLILDTLVKNPLQSLQPNQLTRLISCITLAGPKLVRCNLEMGGNMLSSVLQAYGDGVKVNKDVN